MAAKTTATATIYRTNHPATKETVYFEKTGRAISFVTWGTLEDDYSTLRHVGFSSQPEAKAKHAAKSTNKYLVLTTCTPATPVTADQRDAEIATRPVATAEKTEAPAPAPVEEAPATVLAPAPAVRLTSAGANRTVGRRVSVKYVVSATRKSATEARTTKKAMAIREAEMRAKLDPKAHVTVTTENGTVVHEIAPTVVEGKGRATTRQALREVEVDGTTYEVIYEVPNQQVDVLRLNADGKPTYYVMCTEHGHVHQVAKLMDERKARKAGRHTWCGSCTPETAKTLMRTGKNMTLVSV